MSIIRRLYLVGLAIVIVVMFGSYGYYFLFRGQHGLMDCVYMTVISLTTVGYGEIVQVTGNPVAEVFTMILVTFGMGIILYGISNLTAVIIEGELTGIIRKKKMEKQISKLKNHYIVVGGGETGLPVLEELVKNREKVVLVEQEEGNIERCRVIGDLLYVKGDATDDLNLMAAGIERAAGIVITLPSDKDNLYVTMTARMLNKQLRIITRMVKRNIRSKLLKAGADAVVASNLIGALRMASEMIRPTAVDFLDSMLRSSKGNLRIHEITVTAQAHILGRQIKDSGIKEKFGLLILGSKYSSGEIEFSPGPAQTLEEGMTLIVMGDVDNIASAKKIF